MDLTTGRFLISHCQSKEVRGRGREIAYTHSRILKQSNLSIGLHHTLGHEASKNLSEQFKHLYAEKDLPPLLVGFRAIEIWNQWSLLFAILGDGIAAPPNNICMYNISMSVAYNGVIFLQ